MDEQFAEIGDITLCYETFGNRDDPALLLVMGLGTQMLGWHEDFCEQLAGRGFHVVRFDNRDVGRSTHTDGPVPSLGQLLTRSTRPATYTLADMAADAVGLLDHLGVERAHVVGASMGGMIAQTIAARHPGRVLSLVSIMSNTGSRFTGQPAFSVVPLMIKAAPSDRDGYAEHVVSIFAAVGSPGFPRDDDEVRELARRSWDRSYDPAGSSRQLAAINASGNRRAEIRGISAPTLVIHGKADKLVHRSGGTATARLIGGAQIMRIEGMGHDLPRAVWPRIVDGIVATAARGGFQPRRAAAQPA